MTYIQMVSASIVYTSVYERRIGAILPEKDRDAMELHLADSPEIHPVVQGTGGVRKARWGLQGRENEAVFE